MGTPDLAAGLGLAAGPPTALDAGSAAQSDGHSGAHSYVGSGAQMAAEAALDRYAAEAGRCVAVRLWDGRGLDYHGSRAADERMPAASLAKVPLALACEDAWARGSCPGPVSVATLLGAHRGPSVLHVLDGAHRLSAHEVLGLALALSDNPCADWLLEQVGIAAVAEALAGAGCASSSVALEPASPAGIAGVTTATDALHLALWLRENRARYPRTAAALARSGRNSRIPLGVTATDVALAHKTATLAGVAHDVAWLDCRPGWVACAFLTDAQHDTLVSGYEMGICTRSILSAFGLSVRLTRAAP